MNAHSPNHAPRARINLHRQAGLSMVELLIGILIGLVATISITQIFGGFEARKRVIASGADAQSSGLLALYYVQRDAQNAGFGLPTYNSNDPSPLLCPINTSINQQGALINLSPVQITDGGTASDVLRIRYGTSASGGASVRATGLMAAPTLDSRLLGCQENDIVLFHQTAGTARCSLARIQKLNPDRSINALTELNTAPTSTPVTDLNGADRVRFACLGAWNEYAYTINPQYELTRTGGTPEAATFPDSTAVPVVSDVVALQAQYGIANTLDTAVTASTAAAYLNRVDAWVDATGTFGPNIALLDRNRIRAIRVAVVTRDGALQKNAVSQACDGGSTGLSKVCVWTSDATPINVDLSHVDQWQRYRYRVFEAVIPLRNVIWNRDAL